jgi:hypothetical protein
VIRLPFYRTATMPLPYHRLEGLRSRYGEFSEAAPRKHVVAIGGNFCRTLCCSCCVCIVLLLMIAVIIGGAAAQVTPSPFVLPAAPSPAQIRREGLRWVQSSDRRIVEYSIHGSYRTDASIVVTGYVACPLAIQEPWRDALLKLNVREIRVSLPGFGNSQLQPGRRIIDWPATDLTPVLRAEGVNGPFAVYGFGYGALHALAVAQHFPACPAGGMTEAGRAPCVATLGLRAPYLPRPLSRKLGLPDGLPAYPSTPDLLRGTFSAWAWRAISSLSGSMLATPDPVSLWLMAHHFFGSKLQKLATFYYDFPVYGEFRDRVSYRATNGGHYGALAWLFAMAEDVALDVPGLDVEAVARRINRDRVHVWYAVDDETVPPSHANATTAIFRPTGIVFSGGYGNAMASMAFQDDFLVGLMGRTTEKPPCYFVVVGKNDDAKELCSMNMPAEPTPKARSLAARANLEVLP